MLHSRMGFPYAAAWRLFIGQVVDGSIAGPPAVPRVETDDSVAMTLLPVPKLGASDDPGRLLTFCPRDAPFQDVSHRAETHHSRVSLVTEPAGLSSDAASSADSGNGWSGLHAAVPIQSHLGNERKMSDLCML